MNTKLKLGFSVAVVAGFAAALLNLTPIGVWASAIGSQGVSAITSATFEKAEDAAHVSGDKGVPAWAVESDTPSAKGANGDYAPLLVDSVSALWNHIYAATGAAEAFKAEDVASASADVGIAPLFVVETTNGGTSATDGDYANPTLNAGGAVRSVVVAQSQEGWSVYRNLDIDETSATTTQQLKGSAGVLHVCAITNDTASTKEYVKFYNAVSLTGSAAGTETPVMTVPIAGATTLVIPMDYYFDTGMTVAATTAIADNDTGAPAGNAVQINCTYK